MKQEAEQIAERAVREAIMVGLATGEVRIRVEGTRLVDVLTAAIRARDSIKWDEVGVSLLIGQDEAIEFDRALSALSGEDHDG